MGREVRVRSPGEGVKPDVRGEMWGLVHIHYRARLSQSQCKDGLSSGHCARLGGFGPDGLAPSWDVTTGLGTLARRPRLRKAGTGTAVFCTRGLTSASLGIVGGYRPEDVTYSMGLRGKPTQPLSRKGDFPGHGTGRGGARRKACPESLYADSLFGEREQPGVGSGEVARPTAGASTWRRQLPG